MPYHENGFFEMNKLIIKVEVNIVQAFDERDVSGREMVDSNGFQFLCTQVWLRGRLLLHLFGVFFLKLLWYWICLNIELKLLKVYVFIVDRLFQ